MFSRRTFVIAASSTLAAPAIAGKFDGPRIVITGSCGNVASRLLSIFNDTGATLEFIDKKNGPEFDLAETENVKWPEIIKGADKILHLAATPGGDDHVLLQRNNFLALSNLFDAAVREKVERVVYASSILAAPGRYRHPSGSEYPTILYGWSKRYAEALGAARGSARTAFVGARFGWVPIKDYDNSKVDAWTNSVRVSEAVLPRYISLLLFNFIPEKHATFQLFDDTVEQIA